MGPPGPTVVFDVTSNPAMRVASFEDVPHGPNVLSPDSRWIIVNADAYDITADETPRKSISFMRDDQEKIGRSVFSQDSRWLAWPSDFNSQRNARVDIYDM